jgi:hypothetical protein
MTQNEIPSPIQEKRKQQQKYHLTLRYSPEARRTYQHSGTSLKSQTKIQMSPTRDFKYYHRRK